MATELRLDRALADAVERARRRAAEMGELSRGPFPAFESGIPAEAAEALLEWARNGGYDEAVARVVAEDIELADQ